jgi:hypothetical protein
MREIKLTQGKVALVDDADYDELAKHKWNASKYGETFRAKRGFGPANNHRKIYMHRQILNAPSDLEVDHIDGNGLNNQRSNLRLATRSLNNRNRHYQKPTKHGLPRGVSQCQGSGKFVVTISINDKTKYAGLFETKEEASKAYEQLTSELIERESRKIQENLCQTN